MKAMIFAAGLGSRLRPLTDSKPKALVEIGGKTLLQINIEKLIEFGISDIIVNTHHFSKQVVAFLRDNNNFNVNIQISDETDLLLDTGGGLKKAKDLLKGSEPIILQNVDIISDISYSKMVNYHLKHSPIATLAIQNRESSRYLLFDENNVLSGWENVNSGEKIVTRTNAKTYRYAFSGIHIISPKIFDLLPADKVISIIKPYLEISKNHNIMGYLHDTDMWYDVGTIDKLNEVNKLL
jgi:NDP-sugar pyrophosphorylase family protein